MNPVRADLPSRPDGWRDPAMIMMNTAYAPSAQDGLRSVFSFAGRTSRGTWWAIQVAIIAVFYVCALLSASDAGLLVLISVAGYIAALVAGLATNVRRLHDRGRSGFWLLVGIAPIVGAIYLLVELGILSGEPGPNEYGLPEA